MIKISTEWEQRLADGGGLVGWACFITVPARIPSAMSSGGFQAGKEKTKTNH